MTIARVNPQGLPQSPAFSQATIAPAGRTLYIGGQNGVDADVARLTIVLRDTIAIRRFETVP